MTCDLDIWQAGSSSYYVIFKGQGHIGPRSRSREYNVSFSATDARYEGDMYFLNRQFKIA